jgi:hypothetical protein
MLLECMQDCKHFSICVETVLAIQRLCGTHFIMGVPEEQDGGPELTEEERRQKNIAARKAERLALKKPDAEREKKLEAKDKERAMQGIVADFVLIYPVESEEHLREKAKEALKRGGLSAVAGATGLGVALNTTSKNSSQSSTSGRSGART